MNPHTALLEALDKIASYTTKLDLSAVRVVFFSRLTALRTIIQFMGARVSDDNVSQALTSKLCNIVIDLNMEHLEWPFAAEDEQEISAAITHVESLLSRAEPELIRYTICMNTALTCLYMSQPTS